MIYGAGLDWAQQERGGHGYEMCLRRGHVSIYYGGNGGGVFVEASGQGCRQLEGEGLIESLDGVKGWQAFFAELVELGCTFARTDFALDDTKGVLDLHQVEEAVNSGRCCTRFKTVTPIHKRRATDGELVGHTINFGSRSSLLWIRMYNKRLEQIQKGEEVEQATWVRAEVEAKDERADALIRAFIQAGASAVAGVLRGYLDFKEASSDSNRSRWASSSWWVAFLEGAKKARLKMFPKSKSLEEAAQWVFHQVAPTLSALWHSPKHGARWLRGILESGEVRLRQSHLNMLLASMEGGDTHGSRHPGSKALLCQV